MSRLAALLLATALSGCSLSVAQLEQSADTGLDAAEKAYCDAVTMGSVRRRCAESAEWCTNYNAACSPGTRIEPAAK